MPNNISAQKALFLFDGPNFYKNLKSTGISRGHLNYNKLAENLSDGRVVIDVILFTSPVDRVTDATNYQKQQKFFAALKKGGTSLRTGRLINIRRLCDTCGAASIVKTEKSVDVQIALEMLTRCQNNDFDVLYLASCDSDLIPAISFVRNAGKRVFLLLPLGARGYAVSKACNVTIPITQTIISASQNF